MFTQGTFVGFAGQMRKPRAGLASNVRAPLFRARPPEDRTKPPRKPDTGLNGRAAHRIFEGDADATFLANSNALKVQGSRRAE
jgi:hypothetical protein